MANDPVWWNLDLFLAEIISRNLRDYIHNSAGSPGEYTEEQWKNKLSGIATKLESYESNKFSGDADRQKFITEQAQEAMRDLADVFPGLWD